MRTGLADAVGKLANRHCEHHVHERRAHEQQREHTDLKIELRWRPR
jgi:hypothetical protein